MANNVVRPALKLCHETALHLLQVAAGEATKMGVPQCIAIVDEGCNLLAFVRMDGARVLSIESATRKAMTAATTGRPSAELYPDKAAALAQVTGGKMTSLPGGLPLIADGHVVGGIGVGSGTSEQDLEIAAAAVASFAALMSASR